ncbi:MAG TPA: fatty acid desaturase CarF family protein [Burkholderiales bacterium]|nr:fatty acid desaturase CarF family protein [Burkholderiales bacterium]
MAYPPAQRALELLGVALFPVLVVFNALSLPLSPPGVFVSAILGWLIADLLSGLVHWTLDRFGSERTPIFGPILIRPFREHHDDPQAMTRHDFVETNGASALGASPLFLFQNEILFFTAIGLVAANQCHKWAHARSVPAIVRAAQRLRLILPPAAHGRHHAAPHDRHFCTLSGWLNRTLDRVLSP